MVLLRFVWWLCGMARHGTNWAHTNATSQLHIANAPHDERAMSMNKSTSGKKGMKRYFSLIIFLFICGYVCVCVCVCVCFISSIRSTSCILPVDWLEMKRICAMGPVDSSTNTRPRQHLHLLLSFLLFFVKSLWLHDRLWIFAYSNLNLKCSASSHTRLMELLEHYMLVLSIANLHITVEYLHPSEAEQPEA